MEITRKFSLIEGTFTVQEATSIVLSFYNTKILFHNQQLLRLSENGGSGSQAISEKITALKATQQAILSCLSKNTEDDQQVAIEGFIQITKNS